MKYTLFLIAIFTFCLSLHAQSIAAGSNIPNSGTPVLYTSYFGNDANTCLAPYDPCGSVMGAYDKLGASGGTIKMADGGGTGKSLPLCKSTDIAGCGIWLAGGSADPNWSFIGATVAVSGCTYSSPNATCTFSGGSFTTGTAITIAGVSPSGYNGSFYAANGGVGTVTYAISDPGGSGTGGTIQLAGWRRAKGAVAFVGEGGSCKFSFVTSPEVCLTGGGSATYKPQIWLSAITTHSFANMYLPGTTYKTLLLGVDSTGSTSNQNAASWDNQFSNVSFLPKTSVSGSGPAVTIASTSAWNFFFNDYFQGNGEEQAILSSCVRSSGTTTCTGVALYPGASVVLPASWTACLATSCAAMNLGVYGFADSSFDGIQSATITSATTFTFAQTGYPDTTVSTGGATSDQGICLLGTGTSEGTGDIFMLNPYFAGGGARIYSPSPGINPGIQMINGFSEDAISPIVELNSCGTGSYIQNPYNADVGVGNLPNVWTRNSGNVNTCKIGPTVVNGIVAGPANLINSRPFTSGALGPNPLTQGESGIYGRRLYAQGDDSRRQFGPVATPYLNLAKTLSTSWHTGNGCHTPDSTSITDPSGTSNAGSITTGSGFIGVCGFYGSLTVAAGDTLIAGVWAKSINANGYVNSTPIQIQLPNGVTFQTGGGTVSSNPVLGGNGQWEWVPVIGTVGAGGTGTVVLGMYGNSTYQTDYAFPVLIQIPASAGVSANEIAEIAIHLESYRNDAVVGQASLLPGEQFMSDSNLLAPQTWGGSTPTCSTSVNYGAREFIVDGSTATWGATVAGNGSSKVWVGCNGTNWIVD